MALVIPSLIQNSAILLPAAFGIPQRDSLEAVAGRLLTDCVEIFYQMREKCSVPVNKSSRCQPAHLQSRS